MEGVAFMMVCALKTDLSSARTCSDTLNLDLMYRSSAYATARRSWNLANTRPQMVYSQIEY
jgi:hypothetical protein